MAYIEYHLTDKNELLSNSCGVNVKLFVPVDCPHKAKFGIRWNWKRTNLRQIPFERIVRIFSFDDVQDAISFLEEFKDNPPTKEDSRQSRHIEVF